MNNPILVVIPVGLVAGVGGALLAGMLSSTPAPAPAAVSGSTQQVDLSSIEDRLSEMGRRLDDLEMEVAAAPVRSDATAPELGTVDVAALRAEIDDLMASLNTAQQMPPQFETWVETAQDNIRERERQEREVERQERMDQMLEDRLSEMSTKLGLDQRQLGQMRDTITTAREASTKLMEDMRSAGWGPDSRDLMRSGMEEIRNTASTSLQGFLSTTQYETYQSEYGNDFGMGRGGFGGFGGPGGGRGGRGGGGN